MKEIFLTDYWLTLKIFYFYIPYCLETNCEILLKDANFMHLKFKLKVATFHILLVDIVGRYKK